MRRNRWEPKGSSNEEIERRMEGESYRSITTYQEVYRSPFGLFVIYNPDHDVFLVKVAEDKREGIPPGLLRRQDAEDLLTVLIEALRPTSP